jgi:hypothetical protein
VRALAAVIVLAAAASSATSLGRLADAVAAEIGRVSGGRPVDLSPPEDRTGTGLGLDLDALVRARLEGHVSLATSGPRLTVASTVAALGTRLVWSARVVEEPSAALVDVISVSAPWDPALLPLVPGRAGSGAEGVDVLDRSTTPPIEGRIVALAFLGDERLLVLFEDALALYRRDGLVLRLESRRDLPGPLAGVRFPGGVLLAAETESACWALTSRIPRAVLYSLDGNRLTPTHQADVVPWPRIAAGVRFRPGTNLLEAAAPGVDGPLLALEPEEGWVVGADGALARLGASDAATAERRAGPALARLWPGWVAAASPDPPGEHDRILLYRDAAGPAAASLPVEGAVRALASRRHGANAFLAAALEDVGGGFHVALFEMAPRK